MKTRGKKALLSLSLIIVLGVGATALGIVYFIRQLNDRKNQLAEFILANPESAAVVAYTFDENGELVDDGYDLFYNADSPLVMASTMKIVVLAAYTDAVSRGELDPNEKVEIADWERYYLPMTDGGAHVEGLASLGLAAGEDGFARDQTAEVSLDDLTRIMIQSSGNAETDYLIARLGADKIESVMLAAGLESHTPIHSTLGVALALCNHEIPSFRADHFQTLIRDVSKGDTRYLEHLVELYLHDQNWRAAQIEFMVSGLYARTLVQTTWSDQLYVIQLLPKATAREYARLMAKIASGKLISSGVSTRMQQKLESVPSDWPLRLLFYDRFGAKDGVTAGVLTLASYAVPKSGPQAGHARVVVVLTNQLDYDLWSTQLKSEGHYLIHTDLARDSGAFHKLAARLPELP